ncbi:DUF885 domain-containing protein [Micromonospora olivasterospora]|uniref:DUF885 domain-containing protein n=1 Tax=Micromonospora olivasterospora TaxID=1880 RepID=A0A562I292_MICOL|nr:DUF885 domain-containing protein [Micromonospora olivasterospora]TWH65110.1 hypothetical protein JD77_00045 [Micromonospora olivasterospora]
MVDPVIRDYLLLGLRLGRLVDGFVDCWFGDERLWRQVQDEPTPEPARLARDASRLRAALAGAELAEDRRRFLTAQARALECSARRLAGTDIGFHAEVEAYFDVEIALTDTDRYAAGHDEIAALLPGPGDLRARLAAFHERDRIPAGRLGDAVRAVSGRLRAVARDRFLLPERESVEYEVVGDRPWNAFNRYQGGFHSLVTLNADAGHGMSALPHLATHEVYPGHHTEHCVKEAGLVRAGGQAEQTIALVNTPQCLLAEGMAEVALHVALGAGWGPWTQGVLAEVGLRLDGELVERLLPHTTTLLAARQDAAIMLHDRGADPEEVVAYLRRWMLVGEERARHMVRFLTDPLWRAYTVTYIEGSRLVRSWLAGAGDPAARYRRLLAEPLLPSQLRAEAAAPT